MQHGKFLQYSRQRRIEFLEILKRKHFARDLAENSRDAVFLIKEIGAKPRDIGDFVTEINIASFLEYLNLVFGRNFIEHLFELVVIQGWVIHALELAIDAQHGVVARGKVEVGSLLLEHQIEECVDLRHIIFWTVCDVYS